MPRPTTNGDTTSSIRSNDNLRASKCESRAGKPGARIANPPHLLREVQYEQRSFGIEALRCPCGKQMRVLAAIIEPEAIRAILDCLNLPSRAPPLAPAGREPEEFELDFGEPPLYDD